MMAVSSSSFITSRENHSHGSPMRRKSARYFSAEGLFQRASRKRAALIGRGFGRSRISSEVTIVATMPAGTCVSGISFPHRHRRQAHQDRVDIAAGLEPEQCAPIIDQVEL